MNATNRSFLPKLMLAVVLVGASRAQVAPASAEADPGVEVSRPEIPVSPPSGKRWAFSVDYFHFESTRGYDFNDPDYSITGSKEKGSLVGGTVSVEGKNYVFEASYRTGNSDQNFTLASNVFDFSESSEARSKNYALEVRLKRKFIHNNGLQSYLAAAYQFERYNIRYKGSYNYFGTRYDYDYSDRTEVGYGSLGFGLGKQFSLTEQTLFAPKLEMSGIYGEDDVSYFWGGEGTLAGRIARESKDRKYIIGLDGGIRYRTYQKDGDSVTYSGLYAKIVMIMRF